MKYHVVHTTRYVGTEAISVGHNEAWLTPRGTTYQRCIRHQLHITPTPSVKSTRLDYFGNTVSQFSFNQGYQVLTVTAEDDVELLIPLEPAPTPTWETIVAALDTKNHAEDLAAYEFVFDSPRCRRRQEFADYARLSFPAKKPIYECVRDLMQRFHSDYRFDNTATTVGTPVEQVFRLQRGVCQDFAHLMISMLRSLGLAARYVSGYLRTIPPPGRPRLTGADASHAWLSVYCGPVGWIEFDPTNNRMIETDHITLAYGRDYSDVAPLKGVCIGGGTLQLTVSVDVRPIAQPTNSNE